MSHPETSPNPNPIRSFLSRAELAPRQSYKALTLWPLVWPKGAEPAGPACVPLADALARGDVRIDEVGEAGSVPHVKLTNDGRDAVLFLFGEEILGAKQNRVANASFLVPPVSTVVIDVSCVEVGRWGRRAGRGFFGSRETVSNAMRRKMALKVSASLAGGRGYDADQGEVWDGIHERLEHAKVASKTRAWADYRESRVSDLEEMERTFHPIERQVGFVAMAGDEVVGLEALGRSEVFDATFRTLLRSYSIDAVDAALTKPLGRHVTFDAPEPFLSALREAPVSWSASRGLGSDLRVETPAVGACALSCEGLVHLTAFPAEAP